MRSTCRVLDTADRLRYLAAHPAAGRAGKACIPVAQGMAIRRGRASVTRGHTAGTVSKLASRRAWGRMLPTFAYRSASLLWSAAIKWQSKRLYAPLLLARRCPLFVRNHRYASTHGDAPLYTS